MDRLAQPDGRHRPVFSSRGVVRAAVVARGAERPDEDDALRDRRRGRRSGRCAGDGARRIARTRPTGGPRPQRAPHHARPGRSSVLPLPVVTRHRFHGDPERFDVVASFVADRYGRTVRHIADVAGGQGMLARVLTKKHGYRVEVVDPRGWTLRGVASQTETFAPDDASFYDLIIGLHPDEATRAVVHAAIVRPVVVVPCCN